MFISLECQKDEIFYLIEDNLQNRMKLLEMFEKINDFNVIW